MSKLVVTAAILFAALAVIGCTPEARPGSVKTIGGTRSVSGSVSSAPESKPAGTPQTAPAGAVTKGDGVYRPAGNVDIYQLISLDVAEISKLTNAITEGKPLPSQEILALYEQGNAAKIGENSRALRKFAADPKRASDFPEAAAFYKSDTFLDDALMAAISGTGPAKDYSPAQRRQAIQKGVLRILYHYSLQELMGAEPKLRDGKVDPASGAPHNVDEAWAIYVGLEQDGKYPYSLADTAQKREANFNRPGTIDPPLRQAFARAQKAALDNDLPGFTKAKADVISGYNTMFYVASARYFNEVVKSAQGGKIDDAKVAEMEGFSFYQSIQPAVAKAEAEADRTVASFYQSDPSKLTAADRDKALVALNRTADALGVKAQDRISTSDYK